jgi:putative nucleotidyltransferase with HDIG domain
MSHPALPLSRVIEQARQLPCAPWLLPKLMSLLEDPDASAADVEDLIKVDSGLAAATLRLANSAYFAKTGVCDSFSDAIVRLGFGEVYRLVTTKMASRWLSNPAEGYGWQPGDLYRHSLTVAVAADLLAKRSGLLKPELAYTAGLLHDVGKLALAYVAADAFPELRECQAREQCAWREAEHRFFGYDHCDVGGELLDAWSFPANLVEVVRFYTRPRLAAPEHQALVTHIHAAKHLALCIGTGVGEDGFSTEIDEPFLRENGFGPESLETLLPEVLMVSTTLLSGEAQGV